jgi:hypothetical protein
MTAPLAPFKVTVALPQYGLEEKTAQDAFTHCPVLFVLKMYPPPDKLRLSVHKAENAAVLPAVDKDIDRFDAEGGVPGVQFISAVEEASSVRVVV